jgi:uncharacterized coiled-coil DUF342 family protein
MMLANFFTWMARWTLFFLITLLGFFAWKWSMGNLHVKPGVLPALSLLLLLAPFAAGIFCAGIMALLLPPSMRQTARAADRLWNTRDRFVTCLDFMARKSVTDFERLAIAECAAFSEKEQPPAPVNAPSELRWAAVPLVAIAMLVVDSLRIDAAQSQLVEKASRDVAATVAQLQAMAEKLEKKSDAQDEARKLAERMRKSAEQLRAEAREGRDGEKAALKELAMLEQLVKEMRQQHAATPEELKALANALGKQDETKDAAADMKEGKFGEAAKKLDELAKNPDVAAKAEEALQKAVEHLAQSKEQLSKQMEQLRDNAQQPQGSPERQQLLNQLSQALNELQKQGKLAQQDKGSQDGKNPGEKKAQNGAQDDGGKKMSDDDLKQMLSALQNMKNNDAPAQGDGQPQPSEGDGEDAKNEVHISNFAGKNPGSPQPGNGEQGEQFPTGQPGDKDEKGTTKDPFGQQGTAATKAKDEGLHGLLGTGESLSTLVPSAPGADEKSTKRYRELYNAAAADAEETVLQESIPLGSRFLIKRYFEAIRPK